MKRRVLVPLALLAITGCVALAATALRGALRQQRVIERALAEDRAAIPVQAPQGVDGAWRIPAQVRAALANWRVNSWILQAAAGGWVQDAAGQTVFQLISVEPGSFPAAVGLEAGDIVRTVADVALDGPDAGAAIRRRLATDARVALRLERQGRERVFLYLLDE